LEQVAASLSWSTGAYWRLLRGNRDFRLLWTAQIISEIGDWLYAVAIYSLLLELTGKASAVGIAVVLQLLPQVFAAPTAGVINDRMSRRKVMIFADICRVFIVLGMLFVRSAGTVWLVWILLFLETIMWALFEPGRGALIPNLVSSPEERLTANSLSSMTWAFNLAMGAGVGGLIAYRFGRETVFVIDALSFVASALILSSIRYRETHHAHLPRIRIADLFDFKPILEGIEYVRRDTRRIMTLMVKVGMGLLGVQWVILPVYGERIFPMAARVGHTGSGTLSMSLLFGARGIGALIGCFLSGGWARNNESRMRTGIVFCFLMSACSYCGLAFAPNLGFACLCVAIGNAGTSSAWVFSTTLLQGLTEDRFRGRVFSADYAGLFLTMSSVSFLAGQLIDHGVAARAIAFATAVTALLPAILWMRAQKYFRAASQ
jgi:MFS family permease